MLEWWQALVLSAGTALVTGVVTLFTAWRVSVWSAQAAKESDERRAAGEALRDQREASRQYRRERIQPILDFLAVTKQYLANSTTLESFRKTYEANVWNLQSRMTWNEFVEGTADDTATPIRRVTEAFSMAFAGCPDNEALLLLRAVMVGVQQRSKGQAGALAEQMITSLEDWLEHYVSAGGADIPSL